MRFISKSIFLGVLVVSAQSFATQIIVKNDLRGEAQYYVRYDEIHQADIEDIGLSEIPGGFDDEGYCKISGFLPGFGITRADLKAGDILEAVAHEEWDRTVYDYYQNKTVVVRDVFSKMTRVSDGASFSVGCSIDSSASETTPYRPIEDKYTGAYLTTLGLMVK